MSYPLLLVVLSAVTYRVGRFIALDDLIEDLRDKVYAWLYTGVDAEGTRRVIPKIDVEHDSLPWWRRKVGKLIGCPFCITIWVSAGACLAQRIIVDDFPVPVWTWLAVASGSLVLWAIIDSE